MTTHILLGGNGYLGREVTHQWLKADPEAHFIVVSSSGNNQLTDPRVTTIAADATSYDALAAALPDTFDSIVNFVGRPARNDADNQHININPARATARLAKERGATAIGFIGGTLGPKSFTTTKAQLADELARTGIPLAIVNPTIILGGDRDDTMAKLGGLLRLLGKASPQIRPVDVNDIAADLVSQLVRP